MYQNIQAERNKETKLVYLTKAVLKRSPNATFCMEKVNLDES